MSDRVGLQDYELRGWIERLRRDKASAKRVADELERAVDAAIKCGAVIRQEYVSVSSPAASVTEGTE